MSRCSTTLLELIYISLVRKQGVVYKTCQERWAIETRGKRERVKETVPASRDDDDDDEGFKEKENLKNIPNEGRWIRKKISLSEKLSSLGICYPVTSQSKIPVIAEATYFIIVVFDISGLVIVFFCHRVIYFLCYTSSGE